MACGASGRAGGGGCQAVHAYRAQGDRWLGGRATRTSIHRLSGARRFIASVRNPSAAAPCALLPRHAPQVLGPLPTLGYLSTCPPRRGRPPYATVAVCAGEDSATNLTAATQGRAILAMRYGGVLPGAATTAPAQHVSSVAAVERFISEIGDKEDLSSKPNRPPGHHGDVRGRV